MTSSDWRRRARVAMAICVVAAAGGAAATTEQDYCDAVKKASTYGQQREWEGVENVKKTAKKKIESVRQCMITFGNRSARGVSPTRLPNLGDVADRLFDRACSVMQDGAAQVAAAADRAVEAVRLPAPVQHAAQMDVVPAGSGPAPVGSPTPGSLWERLACSIHGRC